MYLREYWTTLQQSIKQFDENNKTVAKDDADREDYTKQRDFLVELAKLGVEVENANLAAKILLVPSLQAFPDKTFKGDRIITVLHGPLSVAFAEQVYLPHVKRFNEVSLGDQNLIIQSFANLKQEKISTALLAEKLETAIALCKKSQKPAVRWSLFSTPRDSGAVETAENLPSRPE